MYKTRSTTRSMSNSQQSEEEVALSVCIKDIYEQLKKLGKLDVIEGRINDLSKVIDDVNEIKVKMGDQSGLIDSLAVKVDSLEKDLETKSIRIAKLEQEAVGRLEIQSTAKKSTEVLEVLEKKVEKQESYSNQDSLVVSGLRFYKPFDMEATGGVKADVSNSGAATADAVDLDEEGVAVEEGAINIRDRDIMAENFVSIVHDKMGITIYKSDIHDIHLLKTFKPRTTPAVINDEEHDPADNPNPAPAKKTHPTATIAVRFTNRRVRDRIFRAKRQLYGTNIFINEQLTTRNATIYWEARKAKYDKKILQTWTSNGIVIVKKLDKEIVKVKSQIELQELI